MKTNVGRMHEYHGIKTIVVDEKDFSPEEILGLASRGLTPYIVPPSSPLTEGICNLAAPLEEFSHTKERLRMLLPERPDLETYFRVTNIWGWSERKQFAVEALGLKPSDIGTLDHLSRLMITHWPLFWDRLTIKQKEIYKQQQPLPIEPHKFQSSLHYENGGFCYFDIGGFYFNPAEAIFKIGDAYIYASSSNGLQRYSERELISELSIEWRRYSERGAISGFAIERNRFRFDLLGSTTTLTFTMPLPFVEILRARYRFTYPTLAKRADLNLSDLVHVCKTLGISSYSGKGHRALLNFVNEKLPEKISPPDKPGFLFDLEWKTMELNALASEADPILREEMALKYLAFTHSIKDNEPYYKKRVVDPLSVPRITTLFREFLFCELDDPYEN